MMAGNTTGGDARGGDVLLRGGDGTGSGSVGGEVSLLGGTGYDQGGSFQLLSGESVVGPSGNVSMRTADATELTDAP